MILNIGGKISRKVAALRTRRRIIDLKRINCEDDSSIIRLQVSTK